MWGDAAITFVNAMVIAPEGRVVDSLRICGGRIDALGVAPDRRDTVIDVEESIILPGLINAHDHLELNSFKRLKWRERYSNAREWIADFQPRFDSDPDLAGATAKTLCDRVWVGGLKNALAGVTTVCHHNPLHRPLRGRFPVRVVKEFGLSHSLQIDGDRITDAYRRTPATWPWIIHAAEGVDTEAAGEIDSLRAMDCLHSNTVLVHGVGITQPAGEDVIARGTSLVWCPSSNHFLFGATADVRRFDDAGKLALGTDSRLSGDGDLLDELRSASATRQLSAESLVRTVTSGAAEVLRLPGSGRLAPRACSDVVILRRLATDPYDSIVMSSRADVRLTMMAGRPLVAERQFAKVFSALRESITAVRVDGSPRLMARWIADRASRMQLREPGLEVGTC